MTEDEAKKKWCPQSRVTVDGERILTNMPNDVMRCVGSQCMAWRWKYVEVLFNWKTKEVKPVVPFEPYDSEKWALLTDASKTEGFCGLANKP